MRPSIYQKYIEAYWKRVTCTHTKDKQLHLGLPNKYIAPNNAIFFTDQFYWDTYFTIVGLLCSGKKQLACGMVENFAFIYRRFGIIPMRNRYYNLGTSQIPFLSSMIFEIYEAGIKKSWLKKMMAVAEDELNGYWTNKKLAEKHIIYKDLSRYCDHFMTHLGAEHESGWDMTSRFNDLCLDYLPVDLNSCLYKYEKDIERAYLILGNRRKASVYNKRAQNRKRQMTKLMWDAQSGFFFDYNFNTKKRSGFYSVAGFYPLWAGMVSKKQANIIRKKILPLFEQSGGIVNTLNKDLSNEFKQHDYPNGWPQQQYIVIKGLLNYGFNDDAERIAKKWLRMNEKVFDRTGKFWEKYNVVTEDIGEFNPNRYPTQSGFSWTNSIYLWLNSRFGSR